MKNFKNVYSVIVVIVLFTMGCQDKIYERYLSGVPVYMTYEDLRAAVKNTSPQALENPGKIYFKDNFIFINEYFKGIHVIDNQDKSNPVEKVFINIPGNVDMVIKDNMLYADSYIDLVVINISDLNNIKEAYRLKDVFPYTVPTKKIQTIDDYVDQTKGVVIDWDIKTVEKEVTQNPYPIGPYYYYDMYNFAKRNSAESANVAPSTSSGGNNVGVGGSMARFAIQNEALYVLSGYSTIKVLDITDVTKPVSLDPVSNNWGIETIFINGNYMYIGAQSGMSIYDISIPLKPVWQSNYNHVTSCDPVVVDGDYAYVTLRSGTPCRNTITNQMDVIDIKNKKSPSLLKSYSFASPAGLGIDQKTLFICDGAEGLKIFNTSDIYHITSNPIAQFKDIQATDVIPVNGTLFMIGKDGFYQYDYSNLNNVKLLSKIQVVVQ